MDLPDLRLGVCQRRALAILSLHGGYGTYRRHPGGPWQHNAWAPRDPAQNYAEHVTRFGVLVEAGLVAYRDDPPEGAVVRSEILDSTAYFELTPLGVRYVDDKGRECVPVTALKKAIIRAAKAFDDLPMIDLRQAVFVDPVLNPGSLKVPIERFDGSAAVGTMREDAVTIGQNTRGLTYRPEYPEWQLRVAVEYNPRIVSEEQLLALVDQAGWGVGIGEGRPERSSALGWGRFERYTE